MIIPFGTMFLGHWMMPSCGCPLLQSSLIDTSIAWRKLTGVQMSQLRFAFNRMCLYCYEFSCAAFGTSLLCLWCTTVQQIFNDCLVHCSWRWVIMGILQISSMCSWCEWKGALNWAFSYRFCHTFPIPSMYGIFTYVWSFLMVKYGKCR